jgi:hypothetical protein
MSDATGHMDRPEAGPMSTNHYRHENPETGKIEVVKGNPPGTPPPSTPKTCLYQS